MFELFIGPIITIFGILAMLHYAHYLWINSDMYNKRKYDEELKEFYTLLYGDETPPDYINPPRTINRLRQVNKIIKRNLDEYKSSVR